MLPEFHRQRYTEFRQELAKLRANLAQFSLNPPGLVEASQPVQRLFREQVSALALDELVGAIAQRSQAYQVEMDKQLRLLALDVMFLQAAKQAATVQQRLKVVGDRLTTLIGYCDALLTIKAPD
jgi:hypothetical protein